MTNRTTFVLGGARSGKSRYAQTRAEQTGLHCLFIATAQAYDDEMRERIARHRDERGEEWSCVEAPTDLAGAVRAHAAADKLLLIDCLTLWTSNLMLAEQNLPEATDALLTELVVAPCPVILVANEVGLGIVPDNALARRFRDAAGIVNQRIAAACDEVQLLVAGIPLRIKPQNSP